MKKNFRLFRWCIIMITGGILILSFTSLKTYNKAFPYRLAGLTEKEAAAHLLSRFSFGAQPGLVEEVQRMGLEKWFALQLNKSFEDSQIKERLAGYPSLDMTNTEIVQTYPKGGQVLKMAVKDGAVNRDSVKLDKDKKDQLREYMEEKGIKPQSDLLRELVNQKIIRAAYSENQLQEVMTDFWFNHFNVASGKNGVLQLITSYERDVIRPNALGKFETLLLATAKSPAMLIYLDNNKSSVSKKTNSRGLNENYAREIMELHTMGVDGGYTQSDIIDAARILTGWTVNPRIEYNVRIKKPEKGRVTGQSGFVYDNNFLFAVNRHDEGEKNVLGQNFSAGGGYEEGLKLIHLLATHPSTARFICKKLAIRFTSDDPPQSLIDKMTHTFHEMNGDIKEVLMTMVAAPEFWSREAVNEKTKSPFELAISAVRITGADIQSPFQLYLWVNKMGQKIYNYQAPMGFPDKGQYWINSGSLLNRMNFGLALASSRIPGTRLNLPAMNGHQEPESAEAALKTYCGLLLPGRNTEEAVRRLTPMLSTPDMINRENNMLEQVVGIIIGSPEFQRR